MQSFSFLILLAYGKPQGQQGGGGGGQAGEECGIDCLREVIPGTLL